MSQSQATKLKSLKVVDLKNILSKASVSSPTKAAKADLVARILSSDPALQVFRSLYPDPNESSEIVSKVIEPSVTGPAVVPRDPPTKSDVKPVAVKSTTDSELDKQKRRAEKFGVPLNPQTMDPELEKRKIRAERFGIPLVDAQNPPQQSDDSDKLNARAARFGTTAGQKRSAPGETVDADELERRRKRAERFGLT